jgi:hypothetical protein
VESNFQNLNHYEIFEIPNGFLFTTNQGIEYTVYFINGEEYLPNQSYSKDLYVFGFQSKIKSAYDKRVGETIIKILNQFFVEGKNMIVYSCDQSDRKEIARKKLFDSWFNAYGLIDYIKIDFQFDDSLFVSVIYRKDNPNIKDIEYSLNQFGKTLYDK